MKEEQIQKLAEEKYPLPPIEGWQPDYDVYKNDREKWIEGYNAATLQNKDEWISVEDNKPKNGVPVLVFNGHWTGVAYYKKNFEIGIEGEPDWCDESTEYFKPYPTHWQPLPTPPDSNPIKNKNHE